VKPYLLDTNVLLALAWPNHVHYGETLAWFQTKGAAAFRTCPITQTGFVRISSNPAFTVHAVQPVDAMALLNRITAFPGHAFWPDDLGLDALLRFSPLVTHRQVTDTYLVALAIEHGGVLATLDRGIAAFAGRNSASVEVLR